MHNYQSSLEKFTLTKFYADGYRTVDYLGGGGFGKVFLVERADPNAPLKRVVKHIESERKIDNLLLSSCGGDRDEALRLARSQLQSSTSEIQILAGVRGHTNIVCYTDHEVCLHNTPDGAALDIWILKEYYQEVLSNMIQKRHLPLPLALKIMDQVARAVEFLHSKDIIHRDIKPGNILYDPVHGQAKLDDFGQAKVSRPGLSHTVGIGTPVYSAPEVDASQTEYDGKLADIFSLGAVFYECVSGRTPFIEGTHSNMLLDQVLGTVLTNKRRPERSGDFLNDRFWDVVQFATAPRPEDRYQDVTTMRKDIGRLLECQTYNIEAYELFQQYQASDDLIFFNKAKDNLKLAVELDPNCKDAWINLAGLSRSEGDMNQANRCYREVQRIDPSYQIP